MYDSHRSIFLIIFRSTKNVVFLSYSYKYFDFPTFFIVFIYYFIISIISLPHIILVNMFRWSRIQDPIIERASQGSGIYLSL